MRTLALLLLCLGMFHLPGLRADDADEALAKQKSAVTDVLKRLEIEKAPIIELPNVIVTGNLPEKRIKALAPELDRQVAVAAKALKFDSTDKPWPGKLAVYLLAERTEFTSFMRQMAGRRALPEEAGAAGMRGDIPWAVVGTSREGDTNVEMEARIQVANALLQRRAGSNAAVPGWMIEGFGLAVAYRANPTLFRNDRAAMLGLARKHKAEDVWGDVSSPRTASLLAAGLMDYLAFGPEAEKFQALVSAFKPDERGNAPKLPAAFESAQIDMKKLDLAWKRWAASGK